MSIRPFLLSLLVFSLTSSPIIAEQESGKPAVGRTEVKFEPVSANVNGASGQLIEGSALFALSHRWGGQFDAFGGDLDSEFGDIDIRGFAMHIFHRDPDTGMFDFSLSTTDTNDIDSNRIEILVERYFGKNTLAATAGYVFGDIKHTSFGGLLFRQYLMDSLTLNLDATAIDSQIIFGAGFDFRTPLDGVHLFGHSFAGNENFDASLVGIRIYFGGPDVTNGQRDRELLLQSNLFGAFLESSGAIGEALFLNNVPDTNPESGGLPFEPSGGMCSPGFDCPGDPFFESGGNT